MTPIDWARTRVKRALFRKKMRALAADLPQRAPFFIHTSGKVGSSSATATLARAYPDVPVFHTHVLTKSRLEIAKEKGERLYWRSTREHLIASEEVMPHLAALPFKCSVVTMTRHPIERTLSHVFETSRGWSESRAKTMSHSELVAASAARADYLLGRSSGGDLTPWFDREIQGLFGVDVFAQPYDFKAGFMIVERGPVRLLVTRTEDIKRSLAPALSALTGDRFESTDLVRANVGAHKWYGPALAELKRTYQPPEGVLSAIKESRYFQHFYADAPSHN